MIDLFLSSLYGLHFKFCDIGNEFNEALNFIILENKVIFRFK